MKTLTSLLILLSIYGALVGFTAPERIVGLPWKVTINPSSVEANQSVSVTVELTGVTPTAQEVAISGTSGFWSSLPSTVTVPANGSQVTFSATVSSNPGQVGGVTAQCNGGSAAGSVMCGSGK